MKILKGFGIDVKIGDYVSVIYHGDKGRVFKDRGILRVISFQLRGLPKMSCENSKGEIVSFHYTSSKPLSWYREFVKPTNQQIKQFEKTRAKYK